MVESVLVARGVRPDEAACQARVWLEGDLRGQPSHGVQRLPTLLGRIASGRVNVEASPRFDWVTEAALVVDADGALGPPVAMAAAEMVVSRAVSTGVAVASVRNANHLGMLAPYVEAMADRGAIGLALTTSEALVHPWGGSLAMLGTNPIAIAVPAAQGRPLVLDMSTGSTSAGRILHHARNGLPLPEGWAVDATGSPTTDPDAALEGAITPFGGPKGYALGLTLGVLVAALTGTAMGRQVHGTLDTDLPATKGDVLLAFDLEALGQPTAAHRVAAYLTEIRDSPRATGVEHITVPGDRARRQRDHTGTDGIELDTRLWTVLDDLARETEHHVDRA